jgi:putative FmdB family regulatory protein
MPIYEYLCENCGHTFEEMQTMKEESLVTCPKCGKDTLKRLIGAGSGIIFKGSGFYLTDYKKQNSSSTKDSGKKEDKGSSSSDKKTDSSKKETPKPESKNKKDKKD